MRSLIFIAASTLLLTTAACSSSCPSAQTTCAGACVDTAVDVANCGSCGTACAAGQVCSGGACATTCGSNLTLCSGTCRDTHNDPADCGACGNVCATGQVCSAGACASVCPTGELACGGKCVDPQTDRGFCGATADCTGATAGTVCAAGQVCSAGTCGTSCAANLLACGGACVNPQTDRGFCGATADCTGATAGVACPAGQICAAGACKTSCPNGELDCSGKCVDPMIDPVFCGASADCQGTTAGTACPNGSVCVGGACAVTCPAGEVVCSSTCVNPLTDRQYCGSSAGCADAGTACASGSVCVAGSCSASCPQGEVACNGKCIDPSTDRVFCGAGAACSPQGTACGLGELCVSGSCLTSYYASCLELRTAHPSAADGTYTLTATAPDGGQTRPYLAYCADMAGTPTSYITLVNTDAGQNFSSYDGTAIANSTTVVTLWTRVAFDPVALALLPDDFRFSTSTGYVSHENTSQVPYGVARDCAGDVMPLGLANVDLRGTPFAAFNNWGNSGFQPKGSATLSAFDQVVTIAGGGYCGWEGPGSDRLGTVPISLRWCPDPKPEICDGVDNDCDGVVDNGCPASLVFGATTAFGPYGLPTGGTPFDTACPAGAALVGIQGAYGGNIDEVGGVCGALGVREDRTTQPFTYSVQVGTLTPLAIEGANATTPYTLSCPAGAVVTDINGQASVSGVNNVGTTQIVLHCSTLTLTGTPGAFVFARVSAGVVSIAGTNVGDPYSTSSTAPDVATHLIGRAGAWVDDIGITTATPQLLTK